MGDLQAKFVQISREENKQADCLAKATSTKHMFIPNKVLSFVQLSSLIDAIGVRGNRLGKQLDHTNSFLLKRQHTT